MQHFRDNSNILIPNLYSYGIKLQININKNGIKNIHQKSQIFLKGFMGFFFKKYTIYNIIRFGPKIKLGWDRPQTKTNFLLQG